MAVAVASGALGVINATRAETSAATIGDRYLVLQPPLRDMRAAVADFQSFVGSGSHPTEADLISASAATTATDQAYLALQQLLARPANTSLAPRLAALVAAYDASRTGLAVVLTAGRSAQATKNAAVERTADQNLDTALGSLQATVTGRLVQADNQAKMAARVARDDLLWCLGIGSPIGVAVTALLARKARRVEHDDARREAAQAQITKRNEFEGQLQQALEMARAETPAFDMVAQALSEATPTMRSELLLADSSRAHFRQVLVTPADRSEPGCGVVSPEDCPAASRGQTMVFPLSTAINACPNLRGRACSALCVPVSIGGNSAGVIHVTAIDGTPPSDAVRRDVEVIARRASERFAMLRAFEVSQTQANTDSLTGLLTRRSLDSRMREVQDSGVPYAVAYGDLDHFKQLNDVFGHSAGDRALRTFSQVLRDALRPSDVACRYGGEEFVVILPGCPITEALPVLDRVSQRLAEQVTSGRVPSFTVSFGLASSDQAPDFDAVVALADEALLQAKSAGRDQVVVARDTPPQPVLERPSGADDHPWTPRPTNVLSGPGTTPL
jgi:diguanylate cyclase (GGDEF)-like protein